MVMTNGVTLKNSLHLANTTASIIWRRDLWFSPPQLLKKNTIYRLDKMDIVEVGECPENPLYPPVIRPVVVTPTVIGTRTTTPNLAYTDKEIKKYERIVDWALSFGMTLPQLDELVYYITNGGIADLDEDDVDFFVDTIIQQMSPSKNCKKLYESADLRIFPTWEVKREFPEFPFPWTLSPKAELREVLNFLEKRRLAARGGKVQ